MSDRVLYALLIGFGLGVLWGTSFSTSLAYASLAVVVGAASLAVVYVTQSQERYVPVICALLCFTFALGIVRAALSAPASVGSLDSYVSAEVVVGGIVVDEPDRRETGTRLVLQPESVNGHAVDAHERMLVSYPRFPEVEYGDRIVATGTLRLPEDFVTDTGRTFAYQSYLHKDGIRYLLSFAEVSVVSSGEGSPILATLFSIKRQYLESIAASIVEPEASLLGGITVGAKESLGSDITETFRAVGIIHIVVLSGYNISIIADSVMRLVSYGGVLPRSVSLGFGALGVIAFALMTGASSTVVRASIMALLVVVARSTGRVYDITKALFIAGFLMVLHSPYILAFDPSFQLSFMATLGLIVLGPLIEERLTFVPRRFGIREFTTATIATQLFVLPMLLFQSGQLSLVSLLANLLVLIVVPYAMLAGFLAGVLGWVHAFAAATFALIAYVLLAYILWIAHALSLVPYAAVLIPPIPVWALVLMYIVYGYGLYRVYSLRVKI